MYTSVTSASLSKCLGLRAHSTLFFIAKFQTISSSDDTITRGVYLLCVAYSIEYSTKVLPLIFYIFFLGNLVESVFAGIIVNIFIMLFVYFQNFHVDLYLTTLGEIS